MGGGGGGGEGGGEGVKREERKERKQVSLGFFSSKRGPSDLLSRRRVIFSQTFSVALSFPKQSKPCPSSSRA